MKRKRNGSGIYASLISALVMVAGTAHAAELKVAAVNAVKGTVQDVASAYEKASGHKVTMTWGGTEAITKQVSAGEVFDVIIVAAPNVDKLAQQGKVVPGSRTDFARSGIGVAVRSGVPRPDVTTTEGVKKAVLNAKSVVYSTGPSGFYLADLFKRLGIAEQIKDKVKQPPSGTQVGELIARGEADLGFQQMSELMHVKGIDYLGPLPAEIQQVTVYAAGLHSAAPSLDAARGFVRLLAAPESASAIKKIGMDPA